MVDRVCGWGASEMSGRSGTTLGVAFALVVVATLAAGSAATEASVGGAVVTIQPVAQHPQGPVTVSGSGYADGATVTVTMDAHKLGSAHANSSGAFRLTARVPATSLPGEHTVKAIATGTASQTGLLVRTDWRMGGFGPTQHSANPYENVLRPSNVGHLSVAWQQTFGTSDNTAYYSAPSLINGYLYTSVGYADNLGFGYLLKLNASTGAVVWSQKGGPANGPPVVYNGNVYWEEGEVYVTSDATGQYVEQFPQAAGFSQEVLVGNTLYTGTAAIDLDTNQLLWSGTPANTAVTSGFAYADGVVFIGVQDNQAGTYALDALDAATGAVVWSAPDGNFVQQTPTVDNGEVIVSDKSGTTYALNQSTGAQLWATPGAGGGGASPAVIGGVVYQVADGVYALSESTGAVDWSNALNNGATPDFTVAVANGVLYIAGSSLTTIDTATGATISESLAHQDVGLAVVNGNVYASQRAGLGFIDYTIAS